MKPHGAKKREGEKTARKKKKAMRNVFLLECGCFAARVGNQTNGREERASHLQRRAYDQRMITLVDPPPASTIRHWYEDHM